MNAPLRSRSVALTFCAVMVTFLLTFANVSCQGQRVASLSGFQLALGTQVSRTDIGAGLGLIGPAARRLTTFLGGAGSVLLVILINKLEREVTQQSSGMLDVSAGFGLVSAMGLFLAAAVMAWLAGRDRRTSILSRVPDKLPDAT
jgi:hypothetical protein